MIEKCTLSSRERWLKISLPPKKWEMNYNYILKSILSKKKEKRRLLILQFRPDFPPT